MGSNVSDDRASNCQAMGSVASRHRRRLGEVSSYETSAFSMNWAPINERLCSGALGRNRRGRGSAACCIKIPKPPSARPSHNGNLSPRSPALQLNRTSGSQSAPKPRVDGKVHWARMREGDCLAAKRGWSESAAGREICGPNSNHLSSLQPFIMVQPRRHLVRARLQGK